MSPSLGGVPDVGVGLSSLSLMDDLTRSCTNKPGGDVHG
jgi:hypothetical protein